MTEPTAAPLPLSDAKIARLRDIASMAAEWGDKDDADLIREAAAALAQRDVPREPHPAVVFFVYLLLRDYLPAGEMEAVVQEADKVIGKRVVYSNDFLRGYASEIAMRLDAALDTAIAERRPR